MKGLKYTCQLRSSILGYQLDLRSEWLAQIISRSAA